MSPKKRKLLIEFIKENDKSYIYSEVNFKYYTDGDLQFLKQRIDRSQEKKKCKVN